MAGRGVGGFQAEFAAGAGSVGEMLLEGFFGTEAAACVPLAFARPRYRHFRRI